VFDALPEQAPRLPGTFLADARLASRQGPRFHAIGGAAFYGRDGILDANMSDDRQFGPSGDRCQVERVLSVEHLESLADAWNALAQRDPQARIFQSHTWLCTWLRYHHCDRMEILVARRGDRLTAVLPLCAHTRGFGPLSLRVLRFAADNDSDYCDALSDPEYPQDLGALWTALRECDDWHVLDLRYVPEQGNVTRLLPARDTGILLVRQRNDIAPYMDLTEDWRKSLSKQRRDNILRRTRRLREKGVLSFEVAAHPESVDEMLAQMAKIHVARWQARGQTSMFCFEEYRAWLQAFCQRLLRARQLYLCRLALNGDPVSIGLYFLDGRRILGYISTFAASYADYSPGHILEAMVIDDVRARSLAEIDDFGRGGEEYKLQWAREVTVLDRFLVARKTLAGVPAFWWATQIQPFLWRNHHLGTLAREARRRMALRGRR